jgi:hypothetical protein
MVFINESINEDMINGIFHNQFIKGKKKNGDNFSYKYHYMKYLCLNDKKEKYP